MGGEGGEEREMVRDVERREAWVVEGKDGFT
jgi:hypothetical protein